jgi:hypothetical protein
MEHYVALKCNEWRDLIAYLSLEPELSIETAKQLLWDRYLRENVRKSYAAVWVIMFLAFAVILYIVTI